MGAAAGHDGDCSFQAPKLKAAAHLGLEVTGHLVARQEMHHHLQCPRCRSFDELRNFVHPRSSRNQHVPANHRRLHILSRSLTVISILKAA
jgi:hypothetical protein